MITQLCRKGVINPKRQFVLETKLYVVPSNICASPVLTLLHVKTSDAYNFEAALRF